MRFPFSDHHIFFLLLLLLTFVPATANPPPPTTATEATADGLVWLLRGPPLRADGDGLLHVQPRCPATSEAANDEGGGRGANTDSGGGDGSAADTVLTTLSPTMATETAAASRSSATAVDGTTQTRDLWMPPLPLQDLVKQFTHPHHYGLTEHAPKALVGATAMVSAVADAAKDEAGSSNGELHRALEDFSQYTHETVSVEFSVDVFDPIRGACVPYMHPLRAAAARTAKADDAGETASPRHASDLSIVHGCSGCALHSLPGRRGASGWAAPVAAATSMSSRKANQRRRRSACLCAQIFNNAADEALSSLRGLQTAIATDSEGAAAAPANEDGGGRRCSCRPSLHCLLRRSKHQQVCRSLRTDGGRAVVSPRAEHRASTPMQ
ncbi:hypothetical_protein_-_conserved [Leishmania major strain Friedlin]|nr:hypothetical_protein_-_conserved [Leishmania major strain Friedlin]